MNGVLIDTNAYVAFRQGKPEAVEVFAGAPILAFSAVVLGELFAGVSGGTRGEENRRVLARHMRVQNVRVLAVDEETAQRYGEVFARLQAKGTPIPTNDIWIAATAIQHGLALFTYDRHFANVDGLVAGATLSALEA